MNFTVSNILSFNTTGRIPDKEKLFAKEGEEVQELHGTKKTLYIHVVVINHKRSTW